MPAAPWCRRRALLLCGTLLVVAVPRISLAQGGAECATRECEPSAAGLSADAAPSPALAEMWRTAAALHEQKLAFVSALQQVTRGQAGTLGDEGAELVEAISALRASLGRWDAGVDRFEASRWRGNPSAEWHLGRATVLLDRHRTAEALTELGDAARLAPDRADVRALAALAHRLDGRWSEVRRALHEASERDPANVVYAYGLAEAARATGDAVEARRELVRVTRLLEKLRGGTVPRDPFERVGLFRQRAGIAPVFPDVRYLPAYAALAEGRFDEAVTLFASAAAQDPLARTGPAFRSDVARAAAALRGGGLGQARALLDGVRADGDGDAEWHRVYARVEWVGGNAPAALEHAVRAVRLAPADERTRLTLVDALVLAGRTADAERTLMAAADALPLSGAVQYRQALQHQADGRWPEARASFEAVAQLHPVVGRDQLLAAMGAAAVNQADFDGAVAAYARRVDANPNNDEAHRQLAEVYFLQGLDDEALAEHTVAAWLNPSNARAHAGRGHALARLQRHEDAAAALQRAVALGDERAETRYALGMALVRAGHADEGRAHVTASQALRAAALADGQRQFQVEALLRGAAEAEAAGRAGDALAALTEAVALAPSARTRTALGLALLARARPADAVPLLTDGPGDAPDAARADALADAYARLGDEARASAAREASRRARQDAAVERLRRITGEALLQP